MARLSAQTGADELAVSASGENALFDILSKRKERLHFQLWLSQNLGRSANIPRPGKLNM